MPINKIVSGLAVVFLSACSSTPDNTKEEGRWIIADIAEQPSLTQHTPWMSLEAGNVQGHSGCNAFFGTYQIKESRIAFGPIGSTRKACPGPEMKQESALFKLLTTPLEMSTQEQALIFSLGKTQVLRLIQEEK